MQFPYKTIIVDDEELARERLKRLISDFPEYIKIAGEAVNGDQAAVLIETLKPDLVFLDIQMPGKNGFELLQSLQDYSFEVIFVTAFDKYGIQAVKFAAIDYLLKPINIEEPNFFS